MAVAEKNELDALLQLLPACTRCRSVRKRCDTLLPECANCTRSGLQCTFYDPISKESLPREYISSLVEHLRSLEAAGGKETPDHPAPVNIGSIVKVRNSYPCLGKNAPLAAAAAVVRRNLRQSNCIYLPVSSTVIDDAMHHFLIDRYMNTLHDLFPVFNSDQNLDVLHTLRQDSSGQTFLLKMVYSLACHCLPGNDNRLVDLSDALYREALIHIDTLLKDHSIEAVQGMLLLALRSTFDATTGSIGQLVNFSHRLLIELTSHSVLQMTQTTDRLQCTTPKAISSTTENAQSLCAVYALQAVHRGDTPTTLDSIILDKLDSNSPMLVATVRQIHLLIQPSIESAQNLLAAYDDQMVYNIFTSHWIYRAASYLIDHADKDAATDGCIAAARILERCAMKWPNSRALQGALQDLRRDKRTS
ncbi:hypothetical protein ASPVEDRAFT_82796 [Aspergillus versicolor CBS 583.65]|uniref:Zn(2)-C6 fungal-type domain-containing protein n=1 Tax=Aspergillus versicolor CBS 583.65 TaxID=1036611 RepID=A0A1L9PIE8_ASPVE|nr:uncharacterized protein ASPVEDRAFT_82796 [Aspergillus versicolor CBS 583.65]OJJ01272.1 hypothetical protein ASPVEDRAFT_82796 [Aspergillus versicolor CBS 583.65]